MFVAGRRVELQAVLTRSRLGCDLFTAITRLGVGDVRPLEHKALVNTGSGSGLYSNYS